MGKRGNSKTREATKKDAKAKSKAKALTDGMVPLKRSFHEGRVKEKETSPKKQKQQQQQQEADPPRKVMTSNFLSYLVCAKKSVNADVVGQAEYISDHYFKAGMDEKRAIVDGFYRAGGKRPGLSTTYKQCVTLSKTCTDAEWEGYITCGMLMKFFEVCLIN